MQRFSKLSSSTTRSTAGLLREEARKKEEGGGGVGSATRRLFYTHTHPYGARHTSSEAPSPEEPMEPSSSKPGARTALSSRWRRRRSSEEKQSPLYEPFMGSSTRFHPTPFRSTPLTRTAINDLERETLSHSPPSYLNDHLCIMMVKTLRWMADRCFRERYLHRATMLLTVSSAPPAAGAVAAYLRMMMAPSARLDNAPYVPHLSQDTGTGTGTGTGVEGNNYAAELRGLTSQAESHTVHYQIMLPMADITPVERAAVLILQTFHFIFFFFLFLLYPRMGFRLMGYLGEESAVVWTQMVNDIDLGKIAECRVPQLAVTYWGLHGGFKAQEAPLPVPTATTEAEETKKEESEKESAPNEPSSSTASTETEAEKNTPPPESSDKDKANPSSTINVKKAEVPPSGRTRDTLTLRDIVLLIRSDEMVYRDINHRVADQLDTYQRSRGNPIFDTLLKKIQIYINERRRLQQFLTVLETKGISFEQVKGASDKTLVIQSMGFTDPLQVAVIETEWKRRTGGLESASTGDSQAHTTSWRSSGAPGWEGGSGLSAAEQVHNFLQRPDSSLRNVPEELQDVILTSEVLSAALGFGGTFMIRSKNGFEVSSSVPQSLRQLCETALPVADAFLALEKVERTEFNSKSLVAMSLGEVVAEVCTSYAHEITKLQRWSEGKAMPLMGVVSEVLRVGQHIVRLRQILPIDLLVPEDTASSTIGKNIEINSSLLGTRILNTLTEQHARFSGSKQDEELRSLLLRRALVPYLRMLQRWMQEGILEDPFGEFFILEAYEPNASSSPHSTFSSQRRHGLKIFPEAASTSMGYDADSGSSAGQQEVVAFERRFSINKRMIPSFLEKPSRIAKMTFLAGKYCCLLREYNNTLPDFGESSDSMLVWSDMDHLHRRIQDTFEVASNSVIQLLFSPAVDIMGHLYSLKSYFLQGRGDWVVDFLDSADSLLSKSVHTVKVHSMRVLLQAAIARACGTDPYHALISCSFSNASLSKIVQKTLQRKENDAGKGGVSSDPPERPSGRLSTGEVSSALCVDLLQLEVDLEWPLTLVLDANAIYKFNCIFRLLMSVKVCERRLSEIWNRNPTLSTFSAAYGLKHQLVQFFQQFLFYSAHFVLEPQWGKLLSRVGQTESVFSLSQALQEFFESVERGLTLSSITRFKSLTKIIDQSNRLCEVGLHSSTATMTLIESTLHDIEDQFLRALTELASPTGADYATLVPLFTWVDFSGFYGKNNVYHVHPGVPSSV